MSVNYLINNPMKKIFFLFLLINCFFLSQTFAQNQKVMLYSKDKNLAKNKKTVYDFWRIVLEGGHVDQATEYLTESYIQHNPNVPTGRQGFIDFFKKIVSPQPIIDTIKADVVSIVAERDLVVISFKVQYPDPHDKTKNYTTTAFDMFRLENGKIAEHWDAETKQ